MNNQNEVTKMIKVNKNEIEDIVNSLESIIQLINLYPEYLELKEKSTPVLPKNDSEYAFRDYRYCRKCGAYVGDAKLSFRQYPFCARCGQAVLWEK